MTFDVSDDFKKKKDLKEEVEEEAEDHSRRQHQGDRYRDHGANMAMSAAVRAIEYQKQLTGPQAESFASALDKNIG